MVDEGEFRASDAERQVVVDRLRHAVGDGLITLDEFAESAGEAYAAMTRAELEEVTRQLRLPATVPLPSAPTAVPAPGGDRATVTRRRWVVAVMSGEDRRGKWRIGRRTGAFALMGGVDLDLRDAVLEGDEIEITAWAIMGGVTVVVPEGIPVECSGFMLMGGRSNRIKNVPALPGAPVIRVKGFGMWGGIDVRSKPPRKEGDADEPTPWERMQHGELPSMTGTSGQGWGHDHGHGHDHGRDRADRQRQRRGPAGPLPHLPTPPNVLPDLAGIFGQRPVPEPPESAMTSPPPSGLVTIVATDIVGSTRYADTLGDQRWRAVLGTHNALVRERLARYGGTEVKTSGDGFLLTFTSTRAAVQFGVDVQEALADYRVTHPDTPLEVRIGVHAGEVERDGVDVVGRNVSLACRLCDVAAPGEVLVSSVVADLADSASDLAFGDGRVHRLAGIERDVTARPAARR